MAKAHIPLTEPFAIVDTFVSGVGRVEEIASNLYRVIYYSKQKSTYDENVYEYNVVAKFIVTHEVMLAMQSATIDTSESDTVRPVGNSSLN